MTATIASDLRSPASGNPATASAQMRSVEISGPAGRMEALLNNGAPDAPFAALICHPHPLGGGTMHNKVVYHAMKALNELAWGLNWPVLRFNFRGTGLSEGTHDGQAECEDVLAALNWLEIQYKRPLVVVGFSFGAVMAIRACCGLAGTKAKIGALAALGLPTENENLQVPMLADCRIPKLFLSGDRDQFAPGEQLARVVEAAAEPKQLVLLDGADHFFTGQLELVQQSLSRWLKEQLL